MKKIYFLIIIFSWSSIQLSAQDSIAAFPGAEGFGAYTTGGRGGKVIEVTNLNDSGTGSLRDAIQQSGPRTVVFRVSGTIMLNSYLSIKNNGITIAGQTAPGDGITVAGYTLKVDADNVIIRFIRTRLGDTKGVQDDAMNGREHKNIIIDHCTMSWSVDEDASFYDNENFTMQYCMIAEALDSSIHDKGPHGYGGIWGGKGASFHHNFFAHNNSRNPRFCGSRYSNQADLEKVDFRNNVIFNWGANSIYGAEGGSYNLVNNYYKPGPATKSSVKDRIIAPNADDGTNQQAFGVWGVFYVAGNYINGYDQVTQDNWKGVDANILDINSIKSNTEFQVDSVSTQSPEIAMENVLAQVGAVLPNRDKIDNRIIQEFISGIPTYGYGKGIINSQADVGGWPELKSTTPPEDTDHDGMPDAWEQAKGLDINNPDDRNGDINGNGYTNLEDYLNSLVDSFSYIIRPANFRADTINSTQVKLQWDDITDNETGFLLERMQGESEFVQIADIEANKTSYTDEIPEYGMYSYRLRAKNQKDTSLYTQVVEIDLVNSIESKKDFQQSFSVFPNPCKNTVYIAPASEDNKIFHIKVFNANGQQITTQRSSQNGQIILNVDTLPLGVYFIQIDTPFKTTIQKIIKK